MSLNSVRVKNFKAIVNSDLVKLGPLTVFVGNNGSGKSSLIEAMETWQAIVLHGLDAAMGRWLGIEHVRNAKKRAKERVGEALNPIEFLARIALPDEGLVRVETKINNDPASNSVYIAGESVRRRGQPEWTREDGPPEPGGRSMFTVPAEPVADVAFAIQDWQFLMLQPEFMGLPQPQQRTRGGVRLRKDGANIADYLLEIRKLAPEVFEGIVDALKYVLPYARDLQPSITSELERKAYLQLSEANFKLPGWMLSTGTLRVLALLAVLRHPNPPALIVIEEIENGLDPRSIHLLVEEIRTAVLGGITQVVLTTHSPYLLDLLTLEQIVLVVRDAEGHPRFHRPVDSESLQRWSREFAPGRLYTMGKLHEAAR